MKGKANFFQKLAGALSVVLLGFALNTPQLLAQEPQENSWPQLTSENKPWTRWWWMGSAVDKTNLTRELESFAAAGFGGVEITPIYGAKGAESRNIPFLSDKYIEMLARVSREAKRLGLGVDMATGTGWPFGGPQVRPEDADLQVDFRDGELIVKPTGQGVKRAAPGGSGLVLNPYSASAMTHYLEPFTKALAGLPEGALRSQFHDSFEYKGSWAKELPEKFIAMHRYDLRDHLMELSGKGDPDTIARIKSDFRETLEELHLEYIQTWVNWAHAEGELARNQAHGAPGNLLDLYAVADIPETELFGAQKYPIPGFRRETNDVSPDPHPPVLHRLASSAAHVAGHPLASSETFTWLREHFRTAPSQMKPEVDQLFLTGINHIFYHGTAYSPADAPWPGWLFYASMQANSRNPLWSELPGINGYIARCQSMLQAGAPDNDVLLYWPVEDLWHSEKGIHRRLSAHAHDWLTPTPAGKAADELVNRGYAFDFISDRQLQQTKLEHGALKTPGAVYRTVLVPRTEHMPVATLQRLMDLAEQGATVLFLDALPDDVPGFGSLSARREQFKVQLERVRLGTADATGMRSAKIGRGRVCLTGSLPKLLETAQVSREPIADLGVGVIRRRLSDGYGYFMANLSGKNIEGWVKLGRPAESVLMWDPMTMRTGVAALRRSGEAVEVFVQLRSGESIILQTRDSGQAQGDSWHYFAEGQPALPLTGEWHLNFIRGGPELPATRNLTKLGSWTEASDAAAQNFGGTARYEIQFTVPANIRPDAWRLDLGDVRETARVSINGQPVGHVWSLPCDTVVTAPLKPGTNMLTLEVTSTAANRIRDLDKRGVPWKNGKNFVTIGYEPFDASHWALHPTGLLGPVRLIPLHRLQPELRK